MKITLGRKYKHIKTKDIYEIVKIDKTEKATWIWLSKDGKGAICFGKSAFLNSFEEVE